MMSLFFPYPLITLAQYATSLPKEHISLLQLLSPRLSHIKWAEMTYFTFRHMSSSNTLKHPILEQEWQEVDNDPPDTEVSLDVGGVKGELQEHDPVLEY